MHRGGAANVLHAIYVLLLDTCDLGQADIFGAGIVVGLRGSHLSMLSQSHLLFPVGWAAIGG